MGELANCIRCDAVFVKTIRDICRDCYQQEERHFETVYSFLKQKENREATLYEIVEATEVPENTIIKFIKEKRLRTSQFPKLAYPCMRCDASITFGKLCTSCAEDMKKELDRYEKESKLNEQSNEEAHVYYSFNKEANKT